MAEIYTSSAHASQGYLSQDASDHINSVLSDLGLGGMAGDGSGAARAADEPVPAATTPAPQTPAPAADPPAAEGHADAGAILSGSNAGFALPAAPESVPEAAPAPAPVSGADSVPGSHATYGADAFALGTDTLWGSGGGSPLSGIAPAPAGGDTIRSAGGMETIYGGNATIYASGHSAALQTDTVHAGADGSTMDGSASTQALHTDGAGSFDHLPGGSGGDTVLLHDTAAGVSPAAWDHGQDAGAHDPTLLAYGSSDSVIGGDGSDPFAGYGYDMGSGLYDAGTGVDGSAAHHPYLAGGTVAHSDAGIFVSYHDGYDAGYAGSDDLPFKDTVMAG